MPDEDIVVPKFGYASLYLTETFKAPVDGESIYFVLKQTPQTVTLLHPFTLTKLTISNATFQGAVVKHSWDWKPEKIVKLLSDKLASSSGKQAPRADINEIIKHYSQESITV
jgi:hypothetical protein